LPATRSTDNSLGGGYLVLRPVGAHRKAGKAMGRQRAQDYDLKRAQIRDAAANLFAERGFHGSSISDVAEHCGITKPALYHYFRSKEALLYEILDVHIGMLRRMVFEADLEARTWEPTRRLEHIVHQLLSAYLNADANHKVQLNELDRLPEPQRRMIKSMERDIVNIVAEIVLQVNPRLSEAPGLLKPVVMSLFGMLNWHYTWFRENGPITRAAYAKYTTRLFVAGIRTLP
jgi:TetR/AcrR family transcriptional regulator